LSGTVRMASGDSEGVRDREDHVQARLEPAVLHVPDLVDRDVPTAEVRQPIGEVVAGQLL
jgi:hypothetical protein